MRASAWLDEPALKAHSRETEDVLEYDVLVYSLKTMAAIKTHDHVNSTRTTRQIL